MDTTLKLRIQNINNIKLEIKELENTVERNKNTIKRLSSNSNGDQEFVKNKVKQLLEMNTQKTQKIDELINKISNIQKGQYDTQFNIENSNNKDNQSKLDIQKREKELKKQPREIVFYNQPHETSELSMQKEYNYYLKTVASIPDYMLNNLERMPNNRGYIWKSTYIFGKLKAEDNKPVVIFHKNLIHEYTKSDHNIYEKNGKKNKLISSTQRRIY